jgi:hypothetical protein
MHALQTSTSFADAYLDMSKAAGLGDLCRLPPRGVTLAVMVVSLVFSKIAGTVVCLLHPPQAVPHRHHIGTVPTGDTGEASSCPPKR